MAPAFAACVGDFDGDGFDDLFLSQNFFQVTNPISRDDAGRGLWLQGNGKGQFRALDGNESGVKVYGEQRGAALCDFDHDGRIDLVVSQNNSMTKLFHNGSGHRCLRVRLKGPEQNPAGIGAIIRVQSGGHWGPAREIHGGSGYWSQDSVVQLFGGNEATAVEILWPGGTRRVSALVKASEVEIDTAGTVRRLE
jgi:hypothetical protein